MNPCSEHPVVFPVGEDELVGVLAAPVGPAKATAVLVVVGGPQVRAGSHRQFVQLSRHLARSGHAAFRFDVRGMGDSGGNPAGFEHQHDDIAAAIDTLLRERPEVERVVLWGLCDGASASLLYLRQTGDARVGGLVLLNPWVRTPQSQARTTVRRYYAERLMAAGFWRKLLSGGIGRQALHGLWKNLRIAGRRERQTPDLPFTARMAEAWRGFQRPILLVLSSKDFTAKEFADHAASDPHWRGTLQAPGLQRVDLPDADHTFSTPGAGLQVAQLTEAWLAGLALAASASHVQGIGST